MTSGGFPSVVQIAGAGIVLVLRTTDRDGVELEWNSGAGKSTGLKRRDCTATGRRHGRLIFGGNSDDRSHSAGNQRIRVVRAQISGKSGFRS